jgi:DNA polymerase III psi subunit
MGLNDIRLTPQLLTDLYRKALVAQPEKSAPENSIPFLGGNEKSILILVNNEAVSFLPEAEVVFLKSILAACKLSLADVALVNWNHLTDKTYKPVVNQFNSRAAVLFDVPAPAFGLPMHFPLFQVQAFDGRQYVFAPSLNEIQTTKALKADLWQALKKLFSL